ncbi:MAG: 3-hydroxyacyl-ACP dehydratase FabZ [Spirochaetia bacterium]|nr:3-hydroxyacyl-ACP dehydratase FabZ [Spirochaetia bacterium]
MNQIVMDIKKIMDYLPHRYPFLLVDRIIELSEKRIVGIKNVTRNEDFFNGHFPGLPVMPGVLQIEAMAQTAGLYALNQPGNREKIGLFVGIDNARFRRMVVPGDQLKMEIDIIKSGRVMACHGTATVEGDIACEADMKFMVAPKQD